MVLVLGPFDPPRPLENAIDAKEAPLGVTGAWTLDTGALDRVPKYVGSQVDTGWMRLFVPRRLAYFLEA